jgi:hypothetical protein
MRRWNTVVSVAASVGAALRAVHRNVRPVDPAGTLGEQERHHVGDLLGGAEPPGGEVPALELGERGGVALPVGVLRPARGQDRAGADRVGRGGRVSTRRWTR